MARHDYSKPLGDVSLEHGARLRQEEILLTRQRRAVQVLSGCPNRRACLLCRDPLDKGDAFSHRGLTYVFCPACGHLQTRKKPPPGYPSAQCPDAGFATIYPRLSPEEYASRVRRVYAPKLDWFLSRCGEAGLAPEAALSAPWLELGCGAGYFLSALKRAGASDFSGLDADPELVEAANAALGETRAHLCHEELADAVAVREAGVYAAFFVLEHMEEAWKFFEALARKRAGTVLYFSVPLFGLAAMLEGACDDFSARQLDGATHTQLYTDESLAFALDACGFTAVADWTFGQDASDLARCLRALLAPAYPENMLKNLLARLEAAADGLQATLDTSGLADSRHVLAVKQG